MRFRSVHRALRCASVIAMFTALGGFASCSTNESRDDGFLPACRGSALPMGLDGFTPGTAVDWLSLRVEKRESSIDAGEVDGGTMKVFDLEQRGNACAGAKDYSACIAKLDSLRVLEECTPTERCSTTYFVFTRGDEVGTASTMAEKSSLFAPVDTPEEGFHFGMSHLLAKTGYLELCAPGKASRYKIDPSGGVDLTYIVHRDCATAALEEVVVHVSTDGLSVTEKGRRVLDRTLECSIDASAR